MTQNPSAAIPGEAHWRWLVFAALAAFSMGVYLLVSAQRYGPGFPLDDAWIHQTYARNLALYGEWSFVPGQPSAGSTGPLWAGLLSLGHILGLGPYVAAYYLGWLSLLALGVFGAAAFERLAPSRRKWGFWAGALLMFEWHLVWAAASGMETAFFAVFSLAVFLALLVAVPRAQTGRLYWFGLGALVGLSVWVRPDGLTLLGPVIFSLALRGAASDKKMSQVLVLLAGFALLFVPYLLFNQSTAGAFWPNTFYAKQAEYAVLRENPFLVRWLKEAAIPLLGVGVVLLPGFLYAFFVGVRTRRWPVVAAGLWVLGYLGLYAWRLPVLFQYGRYVMPVIPIFLLLGFDGLARLVHLHSKRMAIRVVSRAWLLIVFVVALSFWVMGARIYARDVEIIESEMVATAHWVAENTAPNALIAAHDIGALGYFSGRPIVDLAGLISPDVIPFIRDEARLEAYLTEQGVDALVTFPGWYPALSARAPLSFTTDAPLSIELNYENMAVYEWNHP
ncbi:MAG: hypothetical protein HN413_00790 [Chloroflexi bacterium]|jgi:hypothetical protein|nr:hypothetical protein [Chloroflexota bacterium]